MDTVALFALLIDLSMKQDAILTALQKKGVISFEEVNEELPISLEAVQARVDAAKQHYGKIVRSLRASDK
jgi:DNA-binding Lrp family transcriptional regulator